MKYLVLVVVILAVYLLWRHSRSDASTGKGNGAAAPDALPQDMVRCPVCSLHLPRTDALPGPDGSLYCSQEHRLRGGN